MAQEAKALTSEEIKKVFEAELTIISTKAIARWVVMLMEVHGPEYFWTAAASTSGKYHPKISLGRGGLVRHTKLAVWWGEEFARSFGLTLEERDCVTAALLLHDLRKNGKGLDRKGFPLERGIVGTHGWKLSEKIRAEGPALEGFDEAELMSDAILDAIATHMGVWTTGLLSGPVGRVAEVVHLADYAASRKVDAKIQELQEEGDEDD